MSQRYIDAIEGWGLVIPSPRTNGIAMAPPSRLLNALSRAYLLSETRSGDDPELSEVLEEVQRVQEEEGWLVIRVGEGEFLAQDEVVPAEGEDLSAFLHALRQARITELRLQDPAGADLLERFFLSLQPSEALESISGPERFRGVEESIGLSFQAGSAPLRGMAAAVEGLFQEKEEGPVSSGEEEEYSAEDASAPVHLPEELAAAARRYLGAEPWEKKALRETILSQAAILKESRSMAALAELVDILASPASVAAGADSVGLAREILSPALASFLAARLGEVREEEERARMVDSAAGLGGEMALALADALEEARDRFQRRSFLDAMLAQGPLALEVAQGMVEDPRWWVMRNGVSIIGEIGDREAVSHLTGALANSDARVRRETVLALAKLGGADAEQLLMGMLDDHDAEVRAMTCRAVGVLGVEKALRPLLKILEEEQDQEIQVECLHALGKIGDPGAVPSIEKKAGKGIFSRRSQEIRVAAYRALAAIGTPHARSLLEKAAGDSDPAVRGVVETLLS
jgi:HEAT repeat protein